MKRKIIFHATEKICIKKNCIHNGKPQPIENFTHFPPTGDGKSVLCKDCQKREREKRKNKKAADNYLTAF